MGLLRRALTGTIAAAAGTIALDLSTYGDMAVRGRPASSAPSELVERLAEAAGITMLTADDATTANRRSGVGALLGYANGLAVGAAYGAASPIFERLPPPLAALAVGLTAMAVADIPYAVTGVSDPKTWSAADWLSDLIPHVVYGFAVVAAFDAISARSNRSQRSSSSARASETS